MPGRKKRMTIMKLVYYVWPKGKRDEEIQVSRDEFMRVLSAPSTIMWQVEAEGSIYCGNGYEGWAEEA
jgi:hypothetical protein